MALLGISAGLIWELKNQSHCDLPADTEYCSYICYEGDAVCEYHHPQGPAAYRSIMAKRARLMHCIDRPAKCCQHYPIDCPSHKDHIKWLEKLNTSLRNQ